MPNDNKTHEIQDLKVISSEIDRCIVALTPIKPQAASELIGVKYDVLAEIQRIKSDLPSAKERPKHLMTVELCPLKEWSLGACRMKHGGFILYGGPLIVLVGMR